MATKKEILDILNTIGVQASIGNYWNYGMSGLIEGMRQEVLQGTLVVHRGVGHWSARGAGAEEVTMRSARLPKGYLERSRG